MKYPSDFIDHNGNLGRIHEGHDVPWYTLELDWQVEDPDTTINDLLIDEEYFLFMPRIKRCDKYGGGCDSLGEWHAEWVPVSRNSLGQTKYTVVTRA